MRLRELLGHLRCSVLRDDSQPRLWSDTELAAFLDEAYRHFARRTFCLSSDEADFTTFQTVAEQQEYPLDSRVLRVEEAGIIEVYADDQKTWFELRDGTRSQVYRSFYAGRPSMYSAQVSTGKIRFSPVPDKAYTVQLRVTHLPLLRLGKGTLESELEIPEDYQLNLADYAAWRALKNNDPEGAQMSAAKDFRDAYDLAVRDAKRDYAHLHAGESAQARGNWTGKSRRLR